MRMQHKYNAVITEVDGIKFRSKKEAKYYDLLKIAKRSGDLLFFLRQVPFHLPGGLRYIVDFVEFWKNGDVIFRDVKGMKTPAYVRNKKMVEDLYKPVKIEEI